MTAPLRTAPLRVALIGNPNTGKSTLFTALVGVQQHVGNYPGVTVEKKIGRIAQAGQTFEVIDLPGLYSLAPRAPDQMVAVDVLLGKPDGTPVDAVLCIVDAGNLQRNLYLLSQVLDFELPTVLVVNMLDVAARRGITLDLRRLEQQLGIPVVGVQANRGKGVAELKTALAAAVTRRGPPRPSLFPAVFEEEVVRLQSLLQGHGWRWGQATGWPACLARRLLLDRSGYLQRALRGDGTGPLPAALEAARARLGQRHCPIPTIEVTVRYDWANRVLDGVLSQPAGYPWTATDRLDRLLTHRLWGMLVFAALLVAMFQAVFVGAVPASHAIDNLFAAAGQWVRAHLAEGALRSLLADGIIGGAGGVLSFLPPIMILFAFIAVLEDCGYMARAAYLMDRLMVRVGLSGRSFIPMLSCFACAVPGIMAARGIENERDRLATILVSPLLTCSARLPVYTLLIAALIPPTTYLGGLLSLQGLTLAGLYALGMVASVAVALVLKRTILRGGTPLLLLELPSYKWPSPRTVVYRVLQRAWVFLRSAGTLILAVSILAWAALYYPHNAESVAPWQARQSPLQLRLEQLPPDDPQRAELAADLDELQRQIQGEYQRQSLLGRLGRIIEPVVRPLGWDWRIGCAVLASLPGREIVVATMGVIYDVGETPQGAAGEGSTRLREKLRSATWDESGQPVFNVPVALSIMVFFALCGQCAATLAVIRRETNSWRWPAFTFTYTTVLAYVGALITYQLGMWIGGYCPAITP